MTATMEDNKIRQEILFYYWTGLILYITSAVLDVIHLYQWKGRAPVDFAFHLVLLSINISILAKIRSFKNWARQAFLIKFVIFAMFLYPMLAFKNEEWAYSRHWPHGVFQRVCNFSVLVFEIYFVFFLLRRAVRYVFVHAPAARPSQRS
jgi:hypothetical protein